MSSCCLEIGFFLHCQCCMPFPTSPLPSRLPVFPHRPWKRSLKYESRCHIASGISSLTLHVPACGYLQFPLGGLGYFSVRITARGEVWNTVIGSWECCFLGDFFLSIWAKLLASSAARECAVTGFCDLAVNICSLRSLCTPGQIV